jgi:hypothetical protein
MKKFLTLVLILVLPLSGLEMKAQVAISASGATPNASAMLDVNSSSLGLLLPNFSSLPSSLNAAAPGLVVYYSGSIYLNTSSSTTASWVQLGTGSGSGTVTGVTATSPLASSGGTAPVISIQEASGSQDGYLSSADWSTFNNKGTVTSISTTSPITGGTITSSGTIGIPAATSSTNGYLSSTDWSTFNSKEPALGNPGTDGYVLSSTTAGVRSWIAPGSGSSYSVTSPLALSSSNVISIPVAGTNQDGYISKSSWNLFNAKVSSQWTKSGTSLTYPSGAVGIGTSAPTNEFTVETSVSADYVASFKNSINTVGGYVLNVIGGLAGGDGGAVLVDFQDINGAEYGSIMQTGPNSVSFNTTSDSTLKENIRNTSYSLKDLLKIKVRDFNWKADKSKKIWTGFIAQELYEVYPNAVAKPRTESSKWTLSKDELVPILVKSIQDQQGIIDSLINQMKTQQTSIDDLLKRVQALEKK